MKTAIKKIIKIALAAAVVAILAASGLADERSISGDVLKLAASEEKGYGAKAPVATVEEARAALEEHYKGTDLKVGKIEEKELYFEAEVLDKKGEVSDRVVIDKRTGRIRSIY
jgi:hypothetical protein